MDGAREDKGRMDQAGVLFLPRAYHGEDSVLLPRKEVDGKMNGNLRSHMVFADEENGERSFPSYLSVKICFASMTSSREMVHLFLLSFLFEMTYRLRHHHPGLQS